MYIYISVKPGYQVSGRAGKINHLLYMDDLKLYAGTRGGIESLLNTVRIFSEDIGMQFGLDKCATMTLRRGKLIESEGIEFENGDIIKNLGPDHKYRYLGILEAADLLHEEVKASSRQEYLKRVRKILKTKLNGGNSIKAINTWAVPVIRYTAGIIDWTQAELEELDKRTRKIMTMHQALHPKSDIDRLYISRRIGGRGLVQVLQTVEEEKISLSQYLKTSREKLIREILKENILNVKEDNKKIYKQKIISARIANWNNKPLHGSYARNIKENADDKKSYQWISNGTTRKEIEAAIFAAQDQAFTTNAIKYRVHKTTDDPKCRLCRDKDETIDHLVSGCSKIAQTEYKKRHDNVASMIHWNICKNIGAPVKKNWYNHYPGKVVENDRGKILWDFRIQTDRRIEHNTPDIVVITQETINIIDIAIPGDPRVRDKEIEKINKYQELGREMTRLWRKPFSVIPIVIGAMGAITSNLGKHLIDLEIMELSTAQLQKTAIFGTAQILRKHLRSS